jgi:hypothetical protein
MARLAGEVAAPYRSSAPPITSGLWNMLQHVVYVIHSATSNLTNLVLRNLGEPKLDDQKSSEKFRHFRAQM